ncbi:hypothetical protein DFH28DRAFT_887858 [Melampsora americana]|nr:hypothetical protein DFH28DRAFT_887858 [Melampsora americana]
MSDVLTLNSHPAWEKFQTLHNDYKKFLDPELEYHKATCHELRAVMAHFGIGAQYRRSNLKKPALFQNYHEQLIPYIKPFLNKKENQIEIDHENIVKLDLNSPATTKDDLIREIKKHVPTLITNSVMDRTELLRTYRTSVLLEKSPSAGTKGSSSTTDSRYMVPPPKWTHAQLLRMRRDDIRSALQFQRPDIFIPTKFLTLEVCTRVYEKFILNMSVEADVIVHGVHYYCRETYAYTSLLPFLPNDLCLRVLTLCTLPLS